MIKEHYLFIKKFVGLLLWFSVDLVSEFHVLENRGVISFSICFLGRHCNLMSYGVKFVSEHLWLFDDLIKSKKCVFKGLQILFLFKYLIIILIRLLSKIHLIQSSCNRKRQSWLSFIFPNFLFNHISCDFFIFSIVPLI